VGGRKPPVVEIPDLGYPAHVVTSERELEEVAAAYLRLPYVVFDVETVAGREPREGARNSDKPALDERTNRVLWLALAGPGRVDVIPMGHPSLPNAPAPPQLERWKVMEALRPAFFDPSRPKVGQNVRFDALSLSKYWGQIPPGPYVDLISQVHTLNENLRTYGLGDLAKRYLGFSYAKLAQGGTPMDALPFDAVARYVGLDAKLTQLLYTRMSALLAAKPRLEAVAALEHDVTEVLVWAKHYGVLVDRQALQALSVLLEGRLDKIESKVYSAAGHHFLVTSTQQRAKVLYEELHLPVHERTPKGAPSTSEKALRPLARKHAIVPLLLEHAELSKLQSTYADGLVTFIDEDGRIRCNLKQSGTVTGRLSSSEPNLQNVPRQSDGGTEARIRSMFLASPGHTLVVGDYANVEARFMAHFSGPTVKKSKLLYAFNHGIDLHLMTASGLFDVPIEEITKEMRQVGKTANFLIMFGGSYQRLMESGGFSEKVAKRMHQSFHQTYPEISRWTETTLAMVRQMPHPYVETILGRRRRLPELKAPRDTYEGRKLVSYAERQAINAIIQGSAADVNKMAMVRAFRRIQRAGKLGSWKVLLTVHDEIVLEVPERDTDAGIAMLRESMEQVKVDLRCPLVADIASGPTWAAAK